MLPSCSGFAAAADFGGMFPPGPVMLYPGSSKAPLVRDPARSKPTAAVPAPDPSSKAPAVAPRPAPSEAPAVPEPVSKPATSETASPVAGIMAPVTAVQAAQEEKR